MTKRANGGTRTAATWSTLAVTNLTKIAGVVLGVHEGLEAAPDSRVMMVAMLFAAGGQVSETVLLGIIDRVLGSPPRDGDR